MLLYSIEENYELIKENIDNSYEEGEENKYLSSSKNYLQMDKIMKKLFSLKNTRPIIDFLNSVYGDDISYDAKLFYSNTEINNIDEYKNKFISFYADMFITVKDNNRILEYALEFQTIFEKDMAIRIFRYSFERAVKIGAYSKDKNYTEITLPESYLIVLEEEKDLKDYLTLKINIPKGQSFLYDIKVLRYWKYDLEKLYTENMYLLYPLQLFKLRKAMERISMSRKSGEQKIREMLLIYDELKDTINKTLKAIDKAYYDGKIKIEDYNDMNIIIENLNSYFADMYGKYGNIEEEVRDMVKSFYDPKVEEKGRQEEREKTRQKSTKIVEKLLNKKFGMLDKEIKLRIEKAKLDNLDLIIENILDIEELEDALKYLN